MATESPKMSPVLNTLPSSCYTKTHHSCTRLDLYKHALKKRNQVTTSPFLHHRLRAHMSTFTPGLKCHKDAQSHLRSMRSESRCTALVFPCMSRNQTGVILLNKTKTRCPFRVSRTGNVMGVFCLQAELSSHTCWSCQQRCCPQQSRQFTGQKPTRETMDTSPNKNILSPHPLSVRAYTCCDQT